MTTSEFSVNRTFSLLGNGETTGKKLLDINHHVGSVTSVGERGSPIISTRRMSVGGLSTSIPSKNSNSPNFGNAKKSKLKGINLSWKTKSPSQEDLKNWTRFLSTNSEEMSNSMQFTFNDLKLRTFQGHGSAVRSIDINEHSRLIVSGSKDRTVKLWSLNIHHGIENSLNEPYSECLKTYTEHKKNTIVDVHFVSGGGSGLGSRIVSCDGQVHVWDPETGTTLYKFGNLKTPYLSIKPIFRTRYLVGGLSDTTITFFDTMSHNSLLHSWKSSPGFAGTIKIVCINPSETLIAVGFANGTISLLESRTGTLIYNWKAGDTDIVHLKFYANNRLVSCAPADHMICIWDTDNCSLLNTIKVNSDIVALNMYKDEVITINNSNTITFFPLNEHFQTYSSKFKSSTIKSSITCLGILPINQLLILGCLEGDLFLYA
ncbi:WD40-repeat-containing domain protein [Glomus cerebriforme]|uniref:WD40-repeat-containing domain protein n=1 Tax=Glomus cerebriforme TaxID=658196 RepID=A0A397TML2_9GLOM|nr:WD40-repeat-containing domain protein [Glomus cerebriforme]